MLMFSILLLHCFGLLNQIVFLEFHFLISSFGMKLACWDVLGISLLVKEGFKWASFTLQS